MRAPYGVPYRMVRTTSCGTRGSRDVVGMTVAASAVRSLSWLPVRQRLARGFLAHSQQASFSPADHADGQFRAGGHLSSLRSLRQDAARWSPPVFRPRSRGTGLARGYLRRGDCPAGAEPVAKVIGALAGDVVEVEPGWVAINGVKFSNSQTAARDSAGRPLAHVAWGARRVGERGLAVRFQQCAELGRTLLRTGSVGGCARRAEAGGDVVKVMNEHTARNRAFGSITWSISEG